MAAGPLQIAKRVLVTLLLALAKQYGVRLALKRQEPFDLACSNVPCLRKEKRKRGLQRRPRRKWFFDDD